MKHFSTTIFLLVVFLISAQAQDRSVQLMFVPPALEGTYGIGVYDAKGKLVRTLFADAPPSYFQAGLNGYLITWDGKDDAGQPAPVGSYSARGYVVGAVNIDGEAFLFNDWVNSMDEPVVEQVIHILNALPDKDKLSVVAKTKKGLATFQANATTGESQFVSEGGIRQEPGPPLPSFLREQEVLSYSPGSGETWWAVLVRTEGEKKATVVGQFGKDGEFLRELTQPAGEPPFTQVVARGDSELVWILSADENHQILRGLKPSFSIMDVNEESAPSWEIVFERKNEQCGQFGFEGDKVVPKIEGEIPNKPISVTLVANDLEPGVQRVKLRTLQRADGGWIATEDGLPLLHVSEKTSLRQALLTGPKPGIALWYQSDGFVVEEYRVDGLQKMAAFDIGEFELK